MEDIIKEKLCNFCVNNKCKNCMNCKNKIYKNIRIYKCLNYKKG